MRKLILPFAAVVAMLFTVSFAQAASEKYTGALIDKKCAAKFADAADPSAAAEAKHKPACAAACHKHGSPLVLLMGKDELKLDKAGQKMAAEYLAGADAKTKVVITGEKDGDTLKVDSIAAAE